MGSNCGSDQKAKAMSDLSDFLDRLLRMLSEAGIPSVLAGSVAAATMDTLASLSSFPRSCEGMHILDTPASVPGRGSVD
jgi:hypothetical protein